MKSVIITGFLSVASFAIGLGFEVSGYENIGLAYGLWGLALALAIAAGCLWFIPKLKKRREKKRGEEEEKYAEVHVIEVPEELREKVMGKPKVKGKILNIKNHVVKKKIEK